jgi:hypothetical protein
MCQVDLMKDDKSSTEVAKEGDVHVEPIGASMLMQKDVSIKELDLLKKINELTCANGKSTMNINKPIINEKDEIGLTVEKEESTCLKRGREAK